MLGSSIEASSVPIIGTTTIACPCDCRSGGCRERTGWSYHGAASVHQNQKYMHVLHRAGSIEYAQKIYKCCKRWLVKGLVPLWGTAVVCRDLHGVLVEQGVRQQLLKIYHIIFILTDLRDIRQQLNCGFLCYTAVFIVQSYCRTSSSRAVFVNADAYNSMYQSTSSPTAVPDRQQVEYHM